jgi:tetratricopeptide (TPR) repeat protein
MLSEDIGRVTDELREGTAKTVDTLNWGFSEVLISLGQMNIELGELVRLTRAPSQTWACEQFEIARDEFRRKLYPEALQSGTRAIEGLGSNPGIKTEFRFHFLVGTIRLGSYANSSPDVVNPQIAEQAFLAAARYAQADYPADAGQALICAGRAAVVEGAIDRAVDHFRKGLTFVPMHAEGMYQLGRALFSKEMFNEAADRLADAILLNVEHALHASGDPDVIVKRGFLNGVLQQAQGRYQARYRQITERFQRGEQVLGGFSFGGVHADALQLKGFAESQKTLKAAEARASTNTLIGYSSATNQLVEGFRFFPICFGDYKTQFIRHHREELLRHTQPGNIRNESFAAHWMLAGVLSAIVIMIVYANFYYQAPNYPLGFFDGIWFFFGPSICGGAGVAAAVALIEYVYRGAIRSSNTAARGAYSIWKNSMENEMATIQGMDVPKECEPPSLADVAQERAPADVPVARARGGA